MAGVQLGLAGLWSWAAPRPLGTRSTRRPAGGWCTARWSTWGTLGVLGWLLGRDGGTYRGLPGPPTTAWQVAFGALGVMAASVPAVVFSGQLTSALYGQDAIAPMFAVVDLPPWASVVSVLVVPLLQLWRTPRPSELHDELAGSAMCERVPGRRASRQSAGQAIRMAGCGGAVKPRTCGVLLGRRSRNAALATPWPAL